MSVGRSLVSRVITKFAFDNECFIIYLAKHGQYSFIALQRK